MKKLLLMITALLFVTAVACSDKTPELQEQAEPQIYKAEQVADVAGYRKERNDLPSEMLQVYSFMPYNNGSEYLLLGAGNRIPAFWKFNADLSEYESVEFPEFDIGVSYDLDTADDGTVILFVNHADYGDLEPIGLYEFPEGYDEELYNANAEYKYMIKTFSADGKLLTSADVSGFGGVPDKSSVINGVYSDGETVIAMISGAYEIFKTDGTYIGELTSEEYEIENIGHYIDGRLICAVSYTENDVDRLKICFINPDGTLTECSPTAYDYTGSVQGIQQGAGEYSLFLWSRSTIFGIRADNSEIVPLFNINLSGYTSDTLKCIIPEADGNMSVMFNDFRNYSVDFRKYIPRTPEEMEGIPVITYGVCSVEGQDLYAMEKINAWNDEGHDFMLELKFYTINYDDTSVVFNEIQQDVLSGNLPDIMEINKGFFGDLNLAEKGALCDLYEFIDNDETLTRDSFVPNVLECVETDGALYSLPDRFYLDAGLVAKTKFVGSADDWSLDKYMDIVTNPPVDIAIEYDSKKQRCWSYDYTNWVDFDTLTCHFTDDSFIKFLNWCNEPANIDFDYSVLEDTGDSYSYEEDNANYIEQQRKYIDDKAIFYGMFFNRYSDYAETTRGRFNGEEITFLGTPQIDTSDGFAISANSEHKEMAWEYIKSRCSDDIYKSGLSDTSFYAPFPVTKTGLKIYEDFERTHYFDYSKVDETKDDPDWKDYKGVTYSIGLSGFTNAIQCGEITDEDVKAVNDLISKAKPVNDSYNMLGNDFYTIIEEEIYNFFNGGCTAEQCAEALQSRLSIYISERLG